MVSGRLAGEGRPSFWAPLVALFTGARLAEILCLRTAGLYSVDGVLMFHFRHRPALGVTTEPYLLNDRSIHLMRASSYPMSCNLGSMDWLRG
jgi:hypothetical protein